MSTCPESNAVPSPTDAELLAELTALRKQVTVIEDQLAAYRQAKEVATALAQVGKELAETLDVAQVTDRIVTTILRLVHGRRASLFQRVPASGELICVATAGEAGPEKPLGQTLPPGEGIAGRAIAEARPIWSADLLSDPRINLPDFWRERLEEEGYRAAVGLPLIARGTAVGALVLTDAAGRVFSEDDLQILTIFADQAAIAIENARLFAAADQRATELSALREMGQAITSRLELPAVLEAVVAGAMRLLGSQHTQIILWDEASQSLRYGAALGTEADRVRNQQFELGRGINGVVALTREPMILDDYQGSPYVVPECADVVATITTPVLFGDQLLGVLHSHTTQPGRRFTPDDLRLLQMLAGQAAIAIENARLFAASERAAREARSLYEVAHSLTTSLDLTEVLHLISAKTTELLGTPHAQVVLWDEDAKTLRLGAAHGTEAEKVRQQRFRLGEGVNGVVAQTRAPLVVNDYQRFPQRISGMPELVAVIGVPLLYRDRLLGVLTSHATTPGFAFTPDHLALLTSFADQAAIAIENARLFAELNQSYHDLQQAQDELIRSEKLRALGQMAAGVAHDLNNILAAILVQVELLRFRVTDPAVQDGLNILETTATDGAHVVRRLQDFARQRARSPLAPMDLAVAVQEALEITRPRWRDEPQQRGDIIEVRTSLEGLPPILGHAPEVREAVTNLILNAVDAMPAGGVLSLIAQRVHTATGQRADAYAPPGASTAQAADGPGEWVELTVTDTGSGMSEEVRRRVFEPFFTTKGVQGTGLGLSVVYGIMERHGGQIQIDSAPGRGTTVTLRFQVAPAQADERQGGPSAPGAVYRILLIDDDANVREGLGDLLRAVGHQVTEADGGATGIAKLAGGQVDVVLTDLGMPGVTGWDVARAVKARNPGLPVVLLTGWGDQAAAQVDEQGLVDRVLAKPFRLEELVQVIKELTGDRPPAGRDQVGAEV